MTEKILDSEFKPLKPSTPKQFFARLYGHLEETKTAEEELPKEDLCKPQPLVSSGINFPMFGSSLGGFPFGFPSREDSTIRLTLSSASDAHLAGFSAFRKYSLT